MNEAALYLFAVVLGLFFLFILPSMIGKL